MTDRLVRCVLRALWYGRKERPLTQVDFLIEEIQKVREKLQLKRMGWPSEFYGVLQYYPHVTARVTRLAQKDAKEDTETHSHRLREELASSEQRMEQAHLDRKLYLRYLGDRYDTAHMVNCIFLALLRKEGEDCPPNEPSLVRHRHDGYQMKQLYEWFKPYDFLKHFRGLDMDRHGFLDKRLEPLRRLDKWHKKFSSLNASHRVETAASPWNWSNLLQHDGFTFDYDPPHCPPRHFGINLLSCSLPHTRLCDIAGTAVLVKYDGSPFEPSALHEAAERQQGLLQTRPNDAEGGVGCCRHEYVVGISVPAGERPGVSELLTEGWPTGELALLMLSLA